MDRRCYSYRHSCRTGDRCSRVWMGGKLVTSLGLAWSTSDASAHGIFTVISMSQIHTESASGQSSAGDIHIGDVYIHPSGMRYRIVQKLLNATHYEKDGSLKKSVRYVQLDAGHYPVGTEYVRDEDNFKEIFKAQ